MSDQKKVLIIDDDMDFREMARIVLESENYQVLDAATGEEGLEMIKSFSPDFILLDVMMEEVDSGCKVAYKIATLDIKTPVIMLSSFADEAKQTFDTMAIPVKEYLQKPLNPEKLIAVVKKYI